MFHLLQNSQYNGVYPYRQVAISSKKKHQVRGIPISETGWDGTIPEIFALLFYWMGRDLVHAKQF